MTDMLRPFYREEMGHDNISGWRGGHLSRSQCAKYKIHLSVRRQLDGSYTVNLLFKSFRL